MNALTKASELRQHGYDYTRAENGKTTWQYEGKTVAEGDIFAQATHAAYAHYERQQEALAQAANDAAGEAAYNEAVAEYNEAVAAVHELQTENNKLEKDARDFAQFYNQERAKRVTVESENATLRQQLADAQAKLLEIKPEKITLGSVQANIMREQMADARDDLRRLAEMVLDPVWTGEIEIFAQKVLDRLNTNPKVAYAGQPVSVADAPKYKVGDKVRIKWADYLHGKYEEVEAFDGTVYALKDIPVVFEPFELEAYSEASVTSETAKVTLIQPLPKFMIRQHVSLLGHPVMVQEIRQHNGENQYRIQFRTLSDLKNPPFSAYNWWNENELRAYDTVLPTCPDCGNSGMLRTGGACPCGAMA